MTWSLISCLHEGVEQTAVLTEQGVVLAPPQLAEWSSPLDVLMRWPEAEPILRSLDLGKAPVIRPEAILAPLRFPRAVIGAGVNYRRHLVEMGGEVPASGWYPFFFLKPPTTTVIGPYDAIPIRDAETRRYDWEAELAVVIGIGGSRIPADRALEHVAAYAVANDITARGLHRRTVVPAPPFVFDWVASKAVDGSLPLGPGLTPAFLVPDPHDLRLRLWVNGELQQEESTGDMICTVAELVAQASELVTLQPGDVIITGTPAGVGAAQGRHLTDGDVVRVEASGLGHIENTVRLAEPVAAISPNGVTP